MMSGSPKLLLALKRDELNADFSAVLRRAGYDVLLVGCPEEAQHLLDEGAADLALVDIEWGAMTVASLAGYAHAAVHPCSVAVVVGWWDARTAEVARHADALVFTPPTERQLLGSIQTLLESPPAVAASA